MTSTENEPGREERENSTATTMNDGDENSSGNGLIVNEGREMDNGPGIMPEVQNANRLEPAKQVVGASGPGEGGHKLDKYAYGFWDPQMKKFRGIVFKILGMTTIITILVMWATLPLYWGSLWKANRYTNRLTVRVIDRDGGIIGQSVSQGLLQQTNLKYFITSPSEFPTDDLLARNIVDEGAWAAVIINPDASTSLVNARQNGNNSYNGTSAVSIYYSQARNENAVGSYLVPNLQLEVGMVVGKFSFQSVGQYIQENANNVTAMNLLAQAPSTIAQSVSFEMINLRPYNQPVATAITLVGLIYMLIFAFILTMTNNAVREIM
ncbi:hypothetical protein M231_07935 [Tremella mesenterica]|uniref:DUF3533 domain-containing protein n=1 Tax=Tremella mesenterica TaxID=5217 RepID=A0A4Q1BA24_TREME|nr:hypothetical protein M231_07935 [Tremella mesenterica]